MIIQVRALLETRNAKRRSLTASTLLLICPLLLHCAARWRLRREGSRKCLRPLRGISLFPTQRSRYSSAARPSMDFDVARDEAAREVVVVVAAAAASDGVRQRPDLPLYEYARFENNYSIRILTLEPGSGDEPLVGRLTAEHLDFNPSYEAISYVWGDEERSSEMLCDGRLLPLTTSIQRALQRMRHPTQPRRLWADQVCINQHDIAERGQQVSLMNAIYKGAKHILVWLGPDRDGVAHEAVRMVKHLHDVFEDEDKHAAFRLAHSERLMQQDQELWVPFSKLTMLPWFNRIWIVQEIGTSASATLYWGEAEFDWEVLSLVAGVLNQHYHYLRSRFSILTPNIRYLYRRFVEPEEDYDVHHNRGSFVYELHRARHLLAKDPRDHVYAFLCHFSIHKGSERLAGITAGYDRHIEDIFYDVAVRELTGAKSLILLSACHVDPQAAKKKKAKKRKQPELPSWVPDWRVLPLHLLGSPETLLRAGGDTLPQLRIDEASRKLRIRGVRIDAVGSSSWTFYGKAFQFRQKRTGRLPFEVLWHDVCGFGRFSLEQRYPVGDESAFFAFVQTLTNACIRADRLRPYSSVPKEEWLANGAAYLVRAVDEGSSGSDDDVVAPDVREAAAGGNAFKWSHEATLVSRYRKFAVTSSGLFLMGPDSLQLGDTVVMMYGGKTLFVLRPLENGDGNEWKLIGECYVHGLMNGETLERDDLTEEEFTIV